MLECLRHKGIDILFEWQLNTDADRSARAGNRGRSFIGCLHQPWAATGNDVAAQLRERGGCALGFLVDEGSRFGPAEPKMVTRKRSMAGGTKPGEIVDHVHNPMTESMSTCFTPSHQPG
jgi:hypothetical protein